MEPTQVVRQPPDRWVALVLLILGVICYSADNVLVSVFLEPIKNQLRLSDSSLGLVTATSFAVFYIAAGIPFGSLGDRYNRRNLTIACAIVFSLAATLIGAGSSFWPTLFGRIGVAIGQCGFLLLAVSIATDKFSPNRRPAVMTLLTLGSSIGTWIGASGGGYVEATQGWRFTIVSFGLIGLPIAALLLLTREPVRGALDGVQSIASQRPATYRDTVHTIFKQRSVFHAIVASGLLSFWSWGLVWWAPTYLHRSFGVSIAEAAKTVGSMHGVMGGGSLLLSAILLVPLAQNDTRRPLWLLTALQCLATIATLVAILTSSLRLAVLMLWVFMPMAYIWSGSILAAISLSAPPNMKGKITAILVALASLCSFALAPQLIGLMSDGIATHLSDPAQSLRYAMAPIALSGFLAAVHIGLIARHLPTDSARVEGLLA